VLYPLSYRGGRLDYLAFRSAGRWLGSGVRIRPEALASLVLVLRGLAHDVVAEQNAGKNASEPR
jgi:hypothetical protein